MTRFFNPVDAFAPSLPRGKASTASRPQRSGSRGRTSPIRATQATVRAMRLVRKAAVAKFGRGKTVLQYRSGRWVVFLHDYSGQPAGIFASFDTKTGVAGTGIDFYQIVGGKC